MSLALKQQIVTLEDQTQTPAIKKKLKSLNQQLIASEAAVAMAKAAGEPEEVKVKEPIPETGLTLSCKNCPATFFFSDSEAAYYTKWEMVQPVRCSGCRAAKKATQRQPIVLECHDCRSHFVHSIAAQRHYEMSGFDMPVRCSECRAQKKAMKAGGPIPIQINCNNCKNDFEYSVASQKHFKIQGWSAPIRCVDCRKIKKVQIKSQPNQVSDAANDQAAELAALDAASTGNLADLLDAALASVGLPTGVVIRPSNSDGASV